MPGDPGPSYRSQVHPEIEAVRAHRGRDVIHGLRRDLHQVGALARLEVVQLTDVPQWRHHQVPGVVRERVEDDEHPLAPVQDAGLLVVIALQQPAEHADLVLIRRRGVLHAPRSPEAVHYNDGSTLRSDTSTTSFSRKSSTGTPRSSSPERRRRETVSDEASSSPTISM